MERVLAQMVQGGWRTFLQMGERKWVRRGSVKDKRIPGGRTGYHELL